MTRPPAFWVLPHASTVRTQVLQKALQINRVAAEILDSRGYSNPDAAREFLEPKIERLYDPFLLLGMEPAVVRIHKAIEAHEHILIYGDYDVDGITSVVILKRMIELLGGQSTFHIPDRLKEGYGMRTEVVDRCAASGVRLIISVDTGIRASAVVEHANRLGIDVIVTDHHLPETELPPALAVINPNRDDCSYPCKHLCGAGVTLKLVHALLLKSSFEPARQNALLDSFLKPVAIATVADVVPLTDENRVIVRRGLSGLSHVRNPGLKALLSVAGLEPGESPSAHQVAFRLAPRMNAAGRMATATDVVELFLTSDAARAQSIAEQLDALNRERQETERDIIDQIVAQCEADGDSLIGSALVFASHDWHLGVLGIVASRLVERYYRPVFVLGSGSTANNGELCFTGSGRSIPAFHLLECLESMSHLFSRFGGHRAAAGLTIPCTGLAMFRKDFSDYAEQHLTDEDRRPKFVADATVTLNELRDDTVKQVLNLGPFGLGNPTPALLASAVKVAGEIRRMGNGRHLSVPITQSGTNLTVKAWNFGDRAELFAPGADLDFLLQVEDDPASRKLGYRGWSVSVKDARPSVAKPESLS